MLVTIAACRGPEGGGLDTAYTSSTGTTAEESDGSDDPVDTDTETETGTDTDGPDGDPLWFVVAGSYDSVLMAVDLSNPHDVPPAQFIASGDAIAGLFGPTPFGSEAVTHDGNIRQLRVTAEGTLELVPLATQEGNWIADLWFGDDGANALMTTSPDSLSGPTTLLWARYAQGELTNSFDLTPPKDPAGLVMILDRSPDSRWAAAVVDIQGNGVWDLYLLPIDDQPGATSYVDHLLLTGIPPMSVRSFLSLHLDDERIVYRREALPMIARPMAVGLDNPDAAPVELGPNLPHTYSITPGSDNSRLLVTTGGETGYRELRLIELDGPTSALPPLTITEPNALALENSLSTLGLATAHGHGFDALGRIYYVWGDTTLPQTASVGISLVTVTDGAIAERLELADIPPGATIEDVRFDAELQLLGYRVRSGNSSSIHYIDLGEEQPVSVRVDQSFEHDDDEPEDHANFGWSADGSRIAAVGVQQGVTSLHVAEFGDASGATVEIEVPDVELTPGYIFDHRPSVSPNGEQLMLWYGTQAGRKGLIHAPTDGSAAGQVVLPPQHSLTSGTYLPR